MGFKNKIKGLDEDQIKKYVKRSILDGTSGKIAKSKALEKSAYLQDIVLEATNEFGELMDSLKERFDCPIEVVKYLEKSLK